MWKAFKYNDDLYMIKTENENDAINIYLSDFTEVWVEVLPHNVLLRKFQDSNPLFDVKLEEAIKEVENLVNQITTVHGINLDKNEPRIDLYLQSKKSEFKLGFKFNLVKAPALVFFKEVTVRLIQTVKHLEEQKNGLVNMILKKDRELDEFKLEKGLISREDLITDKYDEAALGKIDDKSMLNVFNSEPFWGSFIKEHGNIEARMEDVKMDPWNHIKRKRKVYSSKIIVKKGKGIDYNKSS